MELIYIKKIMVVQCRNILNLNHLLTYYMNNLKILNATVVNVFYFDY